MTPTTTVNASAAFPPHNRYNPLLNTPVKQNIKQFFIEAASVCYTMTTAVSDSRVPVKRCRLHKNNIYIPVKPPVW